MGRVHRYLLESLENRGAIHMALIDPARMGGVEASKVAKQAELAGSAAIMVGGSIGVYRRLWWTR